jgi:polyphenol oxidase
MNSDNKIPFQMFNEFNVIGFKAGVIHKGPWEDQNDIYRFIGEDLIPSNMQLIVPDQVHGVDIVLIDDNKNNEMVEADGVITCRHDICLSITTADCLPVIIADPKTGYFAAVHVGWRSFVGGIVENIFQQDEFLNLDLESVHFFIGPGIGDCCFEVGADVAMLFDEQFIRYRNGIHYVALREAVENKLKMLGAGYISGIQECTSCRKDRYYSYRRDKETPLQMVTFIHKSSL